MGEKKGGCRGCGKKTGAAVKEKPRGGGKIDDRILNMRLQICQMCNEAVMDENGNATSQKLLGEYQQTLFCGNPNDARTDFSPERYGIGKPLKKVASLHDGACPRSKWGPGANFAAGIIPMYVTPSIQGGVEKGVFYFNGSARHRETNMTDCTGIGDTMVQCVVAQALARERPDWRVRFVTVEHRTRWARFAFNSDFVDSLSNKDRRPGENTRHSALMMAVEIDGTAKDRGLCRQEVLAQMAGLPVESTHQWDYHIPEDDRNYASEFLATPIREGRKIIALAPQCNAASRQWPIRHWVHLGHMLKKSGHRVYILSEPIPPRQAHWIKAIPFKRFQSNNPRAIAAVIERSDLLISNDSGMAHVAGFVGTKATAICGATNGRVAFGGWPTVKPIQAEGPCTGCLSYKGDDSNPGWMPWCSYGCEIMNDLKPRDVEAISLRHMEVGV